MEKELKGTIIEIIIMIIFLTIAVPICINASTNYQTQKETLLNAFNTKIDVNNKGDIKELSIYSNNSAKVEVRLGLMISQFYDEYKVAIDNNTYNLKDLDYQSDEENRYYILGTITIDKVKKIDFQLKPTNQDYFKEDLVYSFYIEGTLENGRL